MQVLLIEIVLGNEFSAARDDGTSCADFVLEIGMKLAISFEYFAWDFGRVGIGRIF